VALGSIIKSPIGALASGGVAGSSVYPFVNAEALTLVSAMSVAPTFARKALIDALITSLKADGIWDKLDILYILAAHDAQAARLNWKLPGTRTATETATVTFTTDRGYAGDGVAGDLNTTYNPSTHGVNFLQDSNTLFLWSRTIGQSTIAPLGNRSAVGSHIHPRNASDQFAYRVSQTAATTTTANTDGTGLFAASRTGATSTQGYRNGATLGAAGSTASVALSNSPISFGRYGGAFFSTVQGAAIGAGGALNGTEHANLYTRLNTYMTAVGA
jgi:hypothetical protein